MSADDLAPRRTAADFVPDATTGNRTSIDIAAPVPAVWASLNEIEFDELRITQPLMAVRALPARLRRRGALQSDGSTAAPPPVLAALRHGRFRLLHDEAERVVTLGVIGQFWRLTGGEDVAFEDAERFVAFDEPGYVVTAIDFRLDATPTGTTLTTETCNRTTDAGTARRFGWYWRLINPGSTLIRYDILRAVRRRAEADR